MSENSIRDCIKQESFVTKELRLDLERNPFCPECQKAAISYHEALIRYLKALEIIKSFVCFDIIEVQGQWYIILGISFTKSLKLPITKDEIYEFRELVDFETYLVAKRDNEYSASLYQIKQENIIKKANTIEELFDEFVLYYLLVEEISNSENWIPYAQYERLGVWQKMRDKIVDKTLKSNSNLYGAIWTDKGLIFKAKTKGILPNGEIDWELLCAL